MIRGFLSGLCLACSTEESRPSVQIPPPPPTAVATGPAQRCGSSRGAVPVSASSTIPQFDPTESGGWMKWLDTVERAAIPTAGGKVSRAGAQLRLELIGGHTTIFTDAAREAYRYAGYVGAMCSHIINMLGGEGSGVFLVVHDSTGETTEKLAAAPIVSPDGKRFALTSMHGEADYDANVIEIWSI